MKKDKYKVIGNVLSIALWGFILLAIFSWPIAYWYHYEKKVFENTTPITWEGLKEAEEEWNESVYAEYGDRFSGRALESFLFSERFYTGYPTEGMHTELTSYEQFDESEEGICIEVDVKNLKPTGIYQQMFTFPIGDGGGASRYDRSSGVKTSTPGDKMYTESYFHTLWYRQKAIYAQYYILQLEDGNRIPVLINDTTVDIPRSGTIQLPYAMRSWLIIDEKYEKMLKQKSNVKANENGDIYYLDAATGWMNVNPDLKTAHGNRAGVAVLAFFTGIAGVGAIFIFILIFSRNSKN